MRELDVPALKTSLRLDKGSKELMSFNTEKVKGYYESHLGCTRGEAARSVGLCTKTVSKALRSIRKEWGDK